ncbi:MAG: hemerythrin domain-containing protein [Deltaproteobacteria bacterium]|nr:hemerythrin domain-containing protein [Deltaproteobacteria bacterium]
MKTIEHLQDEHRAIEKVLQRTIAALEPLNAELVRRGIYFLTDFADAVHHGKEEEVLFPLLIEHAKGMAAGPVQQMTQEHSMGRAYLRAARQAFHGAAMGQREKREALSQALRAYAELTRSHTSKENSILFPLAEQVIPAELEDEVLLRFRNQQRQHMDDAKYSEYLGGRTETPAGVAIDARSLVQVDSPPEGEAAAVSGKTGTTLYDDGTHRCYLLHDFGRGLAVQSNQFLIVDGAEGIILDPGGPKVYPDVLADTMMHLGRSKLRYIFLSHQDPDIGTAINAWMMDTKAEAFISRLWTRFLPHYGIDKFMEHRLKEIPDAGMTLQLGEAKLKFIPAHFLHSAGNFQLYDETSKVLFTGDLGASLGAEYTYVRSFDEHIQYMNSFHRRYMAGNRMMRAWAKVARTLEIEVIAPQHGAMFAGPDMINAFIDWCENLECGVDIMADQLRVPPG